MRGILVEKIVIAIIVISFAAIAIDYAGDRIDELTGRMTDGLQVK